MPDPPSRNKKGNLGIKLLILLSTYIAIVVAPITHVRDKSSKTQGRSPNVVKVVFHALLREIPIFEKGRNCTKS